VKILSLCIPTGLVLWDFCSTGTPDTVAPLAASIGGRPAEDASEWRIPEPEKPLSAITIHGLADDDVPYEGGVSSRRGGNTHLKNETTVALWLIQGWGHVWPGKYFTTDLAEDDPLKNFDAAEIIWDFFKSRRR